MFIFQSLILLLYDWKRLTVPDCDYFMFRNWTPIVSDTQSLFKRSFRTLISTRVKTLTSRNSMCGLCFSMASLMRKSTWFSHPTLKTSLDLITFVVFKNRSIDFNKHPESGTAASSNFLLIITSWPCIRILASINRPRNLPSYWRSSWMMASLHPPIVCILILFYRKWMMSSKFESTNQILLLASASPGIEFNAPSSLIKPVTLNDFLASTGIC